MSDFTKLLGLLIDNNGDYWVPLLPLFSADVSPGLFYFFLNIEHSRIEGFNQQWVQMYLDYDFFKLFRMSKETFEKLWEHVDGPDFHQHYQGGGVPIPGPTQLLMLLWWLGKGEVLLSVAERFNVVPSTAHCVTSMLLDKLLLLLNTAITWPNTPEELQTIEEGFRKRSGYPGVIGAVDGTNIKFKAPLANQDSYIDKNDCHSLKLQVICSHNKVFTNIVVGFPGSVHDARVFRNSQIYMDIENGLLRKYFPLPDYHLIGDKAYPLSNWIMKPYTRDDRNLNKRQRIFNFKHSQTRIVVEHSIGILKSRWRILKYINVNSEKKGIKIIAVCCILHNLCYLNGDFWETEENPMEEIGNNENGGIENHLGVIKRDRIAELL